MIIIGIDPSLSNTGIVIINEKEEVILARRVSTKPGEILVKRVMYITAEVSKIIDEYNPDLVSIESPSFGSFASETLNVLFNFILHLIWMRGIFTTSPSPTQNHKYIKGYRKLCGLKQVDKLQKKDIQEAIKHKTGQKLSSDESDAYWIALSGFRLKNLMDNIITVEDLTPTEKDLYISTLKNNKKNPRGMMYNPGQAFYDFTQEPYPY